MKNVIITGANSGLGFEAAKKVAEKQDYKVILACRNMEKAEKAKEQIISATGNNHVEAMLLDTSSLASVHAFADKIIASGEKVDVLVNNAGISPMNHIGMTEEGFELVFATNYLGHFLLTQLLLPYMAEDGRIYNVSSDMHNPPGGITWPGADALAHPQKDDRRKYSYSKLCMIYMTHELADRLKADGKRVTVNSFNPGFMADTNFSKGGGKAREFVVKTTMPDRYGNLETSSDALADLITRDEFGIISGEYFDRSTNTVKSSELSYNSENAKELWESSMKYCGLE
jgi:NAD(P)-dependent dehydrogenase (short-subunit alcohol dehydrogenase family)